MRAARLLREAGADFNILCTVHAVNGDRGREVYRYFRDEVGATFIQFIPIIERATPELIEIAEAGRVVGDLVAPRVIIADGAAFRGGIDMGDLDAPRGELARETFDARLVRDADERPLD